MSNLQTVYDLSLPAQNLLQISLVKDTDPQLPIYKEQYFAFVSIAPGTQNADGSRGFDVKNKVSIKTTLLKLYGLAEAIIDLVNGIDNKYSIFVDSSKSNYTNGQGTVKILWPGIWRKGDVSYLSLSMKLSKDGKPMGVSMSIPDAKALAHWIHHIADTGLQLEIENRPARQQNYQQQQNSNWTNQQQTQTPVDDMPANNPFNIGDPFPA